MLMQVCQVIKYVFSLIIIIVKVVIIILNCSGFYDLLFVYKTGILRYIDGQKTFSFYYPRDAMLARVFAIATCLDVRLSVCPSHAGIVPSRAKAGS